MYIRTWLRLLRLILKNLVLQCNVLLQLQPLQAQALTERPLSQITVKDIVTDCGINRNTFYYYFEDVPKLIETVVEEDAAAIIRTYPTVDNFGDCLQAVLDTALSKKRAVLHIYHSVNRNIYEMYLWKVCDYAIETYLSAVLKGHKIKENDLNIMKNFLSQ